MRSLTVFILLFLIGCGDSTNVATPSISDTTPNQSESQRLTTWLDEQFEQELDFNPQWRTRLGDKKDYDKLDDASEAADDAALDWRRQSVATMRDLFDYAALDEEGKTSYDLWAYALQRAEDALPFRRHAYLIGRGGPHVGLPNFMINFHRIDTVQDARDYHSRLQQMDDVLRQILERAQLAAAEGKRQPRFNYVFAMDEIDRMTSGAPFTTDGESPLWIDANSKLDQLQNNSLLTASEKEELLTAIRGTLLDEIHPAYLSIRNWLAEDLGNSTELAQGVWALPEGETYYTQRLSQMTTVELNADEIHQIGLDEVARIKAEMEAIKLSVGFEGSLQDFFDYMRINEQFILPDTDEGRQEYISLADDYLSTMYEALPDFFGILPKAGLEVRRVESFREQPGGAQHYMSGTPDGSRPGVFYAHLSDMSAMPVYPLEGIAYHEGVPGHHMQISIAQELQGLPRFRTQYGYTAFSEGWGLYSESLAKDMGFYQDPYSDFGRLGAEIWRAVRLVVDTGMHSKQWSQDQAVQYFMDNSPIAEGAIRSEIERYLINPGQATAYKIGALKIQELRELARTQLGDRFDIRGFHDTVLGGGSIPLPVLEARVQRWVQSQL
ncbi:MAG: DUF885 domain-containing protein [Pseudohongiellaceae bacterium]